MIKFIKSLFTSYKGIMNHGFAKNATYTTSGSIWTDGFRYKLYIEGGAGGDQLVRYNGCIHDWYKIYDINGIQYKKLSIFKCSKCSIISYNIDYSRWWYLYKNKEDIKQYEIKKEK